MVFSGAHLIQNVLNLFLIFEGVCFIVYLLWLFLCVKKEMRYKQRQLDVVKERGERDALTGLYNRNRYEADLLKYPDQFKHSIACIYADANGLHELNNTQGHEAGDRMLQTVAANLRDKFGIKYSYRIGGDEFLAFAVDMKEFEVRALAGKMERELQNQGIHVSVGMEWRTEVSSMDEFIKSAEKKMYEAKSEYYREKGNDRRQR